MLAFAAAWLVASVGLSIPLWVAAAGCAVLGAGLVAVHHRLPTGDDPSVARRRMLESSDRYRTDAALLTRAQLGLERVRQDLGEAPDSGAQRRPGIVAAISAAPAGLLAAQLPLVGGLPMLAACMFFWSLRSRARRVGKLEKLAPHAQPTWLLEVASTETAGFGGRGAQWTPLRRDQLELYTCCVRAERALTEGDFEEAWALVAWWFAEPRIVGDQRVMLRPVASTLLRVATITNRPYAARDLAERLEVDVERRPWQAPRTVYGNAPRAVALARALMFARQGAWSEAAKQLRVAEKTRSLAMREQDQVLYALVAQRTARFDRSVPPGLTTTSPRALDSQRGWIAKFWPQALPRRS